MKNINDYINESLFDKNLVYKDNFYHPRNKNELQKVIIQLLEERGPDANLNDIDVSKVKSMSNLFDSYATSHKGVWIRNIDISQWNMSNVTDTMNMFLFQNNFNCDLSNWDVSKIKNMASMFAGCIKFEGTGLDKWKVSNNTDTSNMFDDCISLKKKPKWYKK